MSDRSTSAIIIRPYRDGDRPVIEHLFEDFQRHIASVDNLRREIVGPGFGPAYTEKTLHEVAANHGAFLIAELEGAIVGFAVGIILARSALDDLETVPAKPGRLTELFVVEAHRGQGVGARLLREMEDYLRSNGCTILRIEVLAPNTRAHQFYLHHGYADRLIDTLSAVTAPFVLR